MTPLQFGQFNGFGVSSKLGAIQNAWNWNKVHGVGTGVGAVGLRNPATLDYSCQLLSNIAGCYIPTQLKLRRSGE